MKSKKLISLLCAAALSASSFAGLAVTASAAATPVWSFDGSDKTGWSGSVAPTVKTDEGSTDSYLDFVGDKGSKSNDTTFTLPTAAQLSDDYVLEYDANIHTSNGMGRLAQYTQLAFTGANPVQDTQDYANADFIEAAAAVNPDSGHGWNNNKGLPDAGLGYAGDIVSSLTNRVELQGKMLINYDGTKAPSMDDGDAQIGDSKWVRVRNEVKDGKAKVTIADSNGTIVDGEEFAVSATKLTQIKMTFGRADTSLFIPTTPANIKLDNIKVYDGIANAPAFSTDGLRATAIVATPVPAPEKVAGAAPLYVAPSSAESVYTADFNSAATGTLAYVQTTEQDPVTVVNGMKVKLGNRKEGEDAKTYASIVKTATGDKALRLGADNFSTNGRGPVVSLDDNIDISDMSSGSAVMSFAVYLSRTDLNGFERLFLLDNTENVDGNKVPRDVLAVITTEDIQNENESYKYTAGDSNIGVHVEPEQWHNVTVVVSQDAYRVFVDGQYKDEEGRLAPALKNDLVGTGEGNKSAVTHLPLLAIENTKAYTEATEDTPASGGTAYSTALIDNVLAYYVQGDLEPKNLPTVGEPEEPEVENHSATIAWDNTTKKATVTAADGEEAAFDGVLIHAAYDSLGLVKSVKTYNATNITTDGVEVAFAANDTVYTGDKLMLWSDLQSMVPYGSLTVTAGETPVQKYTITNATTDTNGTVAINPTIAEADDTITLTVTPAEGYKVAEVKALPADPESNLAVPVTQDTTDKTKYTFTMPAENVKVTATFKEQSAVTTYTVSGTVDAGVKAVKLHPSTDADHSADIPGTIKEGKVTFTEVPADTYTIDVEVNDNYKINTIKVGDTAATTVTVSDANVENLAITTTKVYTVTGTVDAGVDTVKLHISTAADDHTGDIPGTIKDAEAPATGKVVEFANVPAGTYKVEAAAKTGYKNAVSTPAEITVGETTTAFAVTTTAKVKSAVTTSLLPAETTNGTLTVTGASDLTQVEEGTVLTIATTAKLGYNVAVEVKDADNAAVTVENGKFTMPAKAVTVTATVSQKENTILSTASTYLSRYNGLDEDLATQAAKNYSTDTKVLVGTNGNWNAIGLYQFAAPTIPADKEIASAKLTFVVKSINNTKDTTAIDVNYPNVSTGIDLSTITWLTMFTQGTVDSPTTLPFVAENMQADAPFKSITKLAKVDLAQAETNVTHSNVDVTSYVKAQTKASEPIVLVLNNCSRGANLEKVAMIEYTLQDKHYDVTKTDPAAADGTITLPATTSVLPGTEVVFTVTPAAGKKVTAVKVNGETTGVTAGDTANTYKYTISSETPADINITAEFARADIATIEIAGNSPVARTTQNVYTLTAKAADGTALTLTDDEKSAIAWSLDTAAQGVVAPSGTTAIAKDGDDATKATLTVDAAQAAGNVVVKAVIGDKSGTKTVTITDQAVYTITAATGLTGGSISVDKNNAIADTNITVTPTADTGYQVTKVTYENIPETPEAVTYKYVGNNTDVTNGNQCTVDDTYVFVDNPDATAKTLFADATDNTKFDTNIKNYKNYVGGTASNAKHPVIKLTAAAGTYKIYYLGSNNDSNVITATIGDQKVTFGSGTDIAKGTEHPEKVLKFYTADLTLANDVTNADVTFDTTGEYLPDLYEIVVTGTPNAAAPTVVEVPETDGAYTFAMPEYSVKVSATFSKIDYTITNATSADANGTISIKVNGSEATKAQMGDEVTIVASPANGYLLSTVEVEPVDESSETKITFADGKFKMPAEAVKVTGIFVSGVWYNDDYTGYSELLGSDAEKTLIVGASETDAAPVVPDFTGFTGLTMSTSGAKNNTNIKNNWAKLVKDGEEYYISLNSGSASTAGRGVNLKITNETPGERKYTILELDASIGAGGLVLSGSTANPPAEELGLNVTNGLTANKRANIKVILGSDTAQIVVTDADNKIYVTDISKLKLTKLTGVQAFVTNSSAKIYSMKLYGTNEEQFYPATITVQDTGNENAAVEGIPVSVAGQTLETNASGQVSIDLPIGTYTVATTAVAGWNNGNAQLTVSGAESAPNSAVISVTEKAQVPTTASLSGGPLFDKAADGDNRDLAAYVPILLDAESVEIEAGDDLTWTWSIAEADTSKATVTNGVVTLTGANVGDTITVNAYPTYKGTPYESVKATKTITVVAASTRTVSVPVGSTAGTLDGRWSLAANGAVAGEALGHTTSFIPAPTWSWISSGATGAGTLVLEADVMLKDGDMLDITAKKGSAVGTDLKLTAASGKVTAVAGNTSRSDQAKELTTVTKDVNMTTNAWYKVKFIFTVTASGTTAASAEVYAINSDGTDGNKVLEGTGLYLRNLNASTRVDTYQIAKTGTPYMDNVQCYITPATE